MRLPVATAIEAAHLDEAKERLILARQTHLDSLVSKLLERENARRRLGVRASRDGRARPCTRWATLGPESCYRYRR